MTAPLSPTSDAVAVTTAEQRAGFRLHRVELFNWGTFDGKIWGFQTGGDTSLLTGDIGSGKSTVVDALTTLLVAPTKIVYNKAAGADARERTQRSYFYGYYKAERSDTGTGAKPVMLRDANSYSVLLAQFFNEGYGQHVTLAQVFFMREQDGNPSRVCVVADQRLSIAEHFSNFSDIAELRRRLKRLTPDVSDTFPPYQAAFRKRLGIQNDQALELFHQTVSMKAVGNLTDFVREHMLQPFPVAERIAEVMQHFDNLTGAHHAVLKAKEQVTQLTPIVDGCDEYDIVAAMVNEDRACRDAMKPWFASMRVELLESGIGNTSAQLDSLRVDIDAAAAAHQELGSQRDGLKHDIAQNGGDRIERLKSELAARLRERGERSQRHKTYSQTASEAGVEVPIDPHAFAASLRQASQLSTEGDAELGRLREKAVDGGVKFKLCADEQNHLTAEIASLKKAKSNIPASHLMIRDRLCEALSIDQNEVPFAGELMQVHPDASAWEGAVERVLRGFGMSLLVPDEHYTAISNWVDKTHLGNRLVYLRVRKDGKQARVPASEPNSLVRKLEFKHGAPLVDWLEEEVSRRFTLVCCETMDEFRRAKDALSLAGQVKGGIQHSKDDRSRIDDRTRYVLGWANEAKLAALTRDLNAIEEKARALATALSELQKKERELRRRVEALKALTVYSAFDEIDWESRARAATEVEEELKEAESAASDLLRGLEKRLAVIDQNLEASTKELGRLRDQHTRIDERRSTLQKQLLTATTAVTSTTDAERARFPRLADLKAESAGNALSLENAEASERDLREWLQNKIDTADSRCGRMKLSIARAMQDYRTAWPVETREADASVEAAGEYRRMLKTLREDDLPRFESKFKELLNENTIREVANFQSQLLKERHEIQERIETINGSLRTIDFNPGRFIRLEATHTPDSEVRDFQADLKACTEGTILGATDETYSETKFLQVKKIIERFRGREGSTEADLKWTRKVTDVRNWFAFSVSERWAEDDREHEHYTDSGGKSGGQKEKLAYTVLAASLAYQFGLEWGETRSKSMRFVVIDEAFGRGSDDSATYGLELFQRLNLQLLVVTPLQKIHVIEPFVANVGYVSNADGKNSKLRNLTIAQYREEKARRAG